MINAEGLVELLNACARIVEQLPFRVGVFKNLTTGPRLFNAPKDARKRRKGRCVRIRKKTDSHV